MASSGDSHQVLYVKDGVFIHTQINSDDEDALVEGSICLLQKQPEGLFVEWTPNSQFVNDENNTAQNGEPNGNKSDGWAVIDTVGYKNTKDQQAETVTLKKQPKPRNTLNRHKYIINFELADLKSFKRSGPGLGWSYLVFILKDGSTCPAVHFHKGGSKAFVRELEKYLTIKKSPNDSSLYLVCVHDPNALSKSFDELQLFGEHSADQVWLPKVLRNTSTTTQKFFKDPYSTTLGGFSKVTNFLRDALLFPDNVPMHQHPDMSSILQEDVTLPGMEVSNVEEPGFEVVTRMELPARPEIKRSNPLTSQQWSKHMDSEGKIINVEALKEAIFRGGVDANIRIELWKFLLYYYSWDSTYKTRSEQRKTKVDTYFTMKLQWKSVSEEQERRFSAMKERKSLIEKDVSRTDRTHSFFQGDDNPNLQVLYDILMTYCMYNFDLGYVQGMSDLLAPILVVMENEVDAFWCFVGYMELVCKNFEMDQAGMKKQLAQLQTLIKFVDPQLSNYLESHDSSNMFFCFRWLLIHFKREFSFPDIMRLWEVLWTGQPCENFHLLMCVAILDKEKTTLMDNNFGFTEILRHVNDMSMTIELETTLKTAEAIYLQLRDCKKVPSAISEIVGLPKEGSSSSNQTSEASSSASTPSKDRVLLSLKTTSDTTNTTSGSPQELNGSHTNVTTPDDSSIEMLPAVATDFVY